MTIACTEILPHIDFTQKKILYRLQHASRRTEMLLRAMGQQDRAATHIIDATAGFGQDALLLAASGYRVTMLERSPIMHAALAAALQRAQHHPLLQSYVARLSLQHVDAVAYLPLHPAHIIYLDPMFPVRHKSAAVKKPMRLLQQLVATAPDNVAQLFAMALSCASVRVVVKRPRLGATITQATPNFSIVGNSSRFDIYLPAARE